MSVPSTPPPAADNPSATPSASRPPAAPLSRTLQWIVWSTLGLAVCGLLVLAVRQQWQRAEQKGVTALPRFNTVPAFTFTERSGQPFDSASLRGHVWLADFFFTACPGPCLTMNGKLQEIQGALAKDKTEAVRMVSFSIAPEMDTPEVLRKYALRFHAQEGRWFFLTGEREAIYRVAHDVFMLPVIKTDPAKRDPEQGEYIHSMKIALVDRQGVVRGYYDSNSPEIVQRVLVDVGNLLREKPGGGHPPTAVVATPAP